MDRRMARSRKGSHSGCADNGAIILSGDTDRRDSSPFGELIEPLLQAVRIDRANEEGIPGGPHPPPHPTPAPSVFVTMQ